MHRQRSTAAHNRHAADSAARAEKEADRAKCHAADAAAAARRADASESALAHTIHRVQDLAAATRAAEVSAARAAIAAIGSAVITIATAILTIIATA